LLLYNLMGLGGSIDMMVQRCFSTVVGMVLGMDSRVFTPVGLYLPSGFRITLFVGSGIFGITNTRYKLLATCHVRPAACADPLQLVEGSHATLAADGTIIHNCASGRGKSEWGVLASS
jgi:hypothetical protein